MLLTPFTPSPQVRSKGTLPQTLISVCHFGSLKFWVPAAGPQCRFRLTTSPTGIDKRPELAICFKLGTKTEPVMSRAESAVWSFPRGRLTCPDAPSSVAWRDQAGAAYVWFPFNYWDRIWPSLPGSSPAGRCPMSTAAPSTALATIQPAFTDPERLALAGYLAGYGGLTREAYVLDLSQFTSPPNG